MHLDDCDVLAVGKKADIIMINLAMPNMQPLNNIAKNIVYSGSKINVKMTMIDGVIKYMDGKFNVGHSEDIIYGKVKDIKKLLLN
jgi:5-methylthioadenosine/S-adenosylhomocysteine deaminase